MANESPQTRSFEAEWRRRFERYGQSYGEDHDVSGWSERGLATRLQVFGSLYPRMASSRPGRVLDVGCGPGTYGRWLSERGDMTVGLDYSLPSLRRALLKAPARGRAVYAQGEAYNLPFRSGVFDAVVCIGVLQTLADEQCAMQEMTRVLRPQGLLVLDGLNALGFSPLVHWIRRLRDGVWHEVRRYSPFSLRRRLSALGYDGIRIFPVVILPLRSGRLTRFLSQAGCLASFIAHSFFLVARKGERADQRLTITSNV